MRILLTALLFLSLSSFHVHAQFQKLIVNEVSQGNSGTREYVELLVVGTRTCTDSTKDIRGWIFDDHNGWFGGAGVAAGHYRFAINDNWKAVPFGSIILLYNNADKNTSITLPDDPTDANNDGIYIIPISNSLIEKNTTSPAGGASSVSFTYSASATYSGTGTWNGFGLSNSGDAVLVVDPADLTKDHFSITFFGTPSAGYKTPTIQKATLSGGRNLYLSDRNYANANSWVMGSVPANETPGAPNGGDNTAWINSMKVPAAAPSITLGANPVICQGITTADLPYTAIAGGTSEYTIDWNAAAEAAGLADVATATTLPASPIGLTVPATIAAGTYTGTIVPRNGTCVGTGVTFTLTVNVRPSLTTGAGTVPNTLCIGESAQFSNSTVGGTWSSSDPSVATVDATGTVTAVGAGTTTFTYLVTNASGCSNQFDFTLTVNAPPTVSAIGGTSNICEGTSTTYTNPTAGGVWGSSNTAVATVDPATGVVTAVSAGTTDITYTITSTCGNPSATYTLAVDPVPTITLGAIAPICISNTTFDLPYTAITGSPTQYSITWDAAALAAGLTNVSGQALPSTSPIVVPVPVGTPAGAYNGTITVSNGTCTSTAVAFSFTKNASPTVPASTGTSVLCVGATTTLSNTMAGGTWSSSNTAVATVDANTGVVTAVSTGSADIRYTVTNSCGSSKSDFTITVSEIPSITLGPNPSICRGATTASLPFTSTGGAPTHYEVTWDASALAAGFSNVANQVLPATSPVNLSIPPSASNGTYSGMITVNNGSCTGAATNFTVVINDKPIVGAISGTADLCVGGNYTFTNTSPGGVWSSTDNTIATVSASGDVTGVAAGIGGIEYTVTNGCGSTTVNFPISVSAIPSITLGASTSICQGVSNAALQYTAVAGGTDQYTITWDAGALAAGFTNVSATPLPASGPIMLTVPATLAPGTYNGMITPVNASCTGTPVTFTLTVSSIPTVASTNGTATICQGGTTTLTNTTPGGVWSSTNTAVATVNATGMVTAVSAGSATIRYTVTNGCGSRSADFDITINPVPVVPAITGVKKVCVAGTTTLSNTSIGGTWSSSNTAVATVNPTTGVVTGITAGTATITYTVNTGGCVASQTTDVTVEQLALTLTASPNPVNSGDIVQLRTSASIPYTVQSWTPAALFINQTALNQSVRLDAQTRVGVTAVSDAGCTVTSEVVIDVKSSNDLFIPNAFSPNRNGNNDVFRVYGTSIRSLELKVFNQWGELLFSTNEVGKGWDGTAKGKPQPVGVYAYAAIITLQDGTVLHKKGSVNLIR